MTDTSSIMTTRLHDAVKYGRLQDVKNCIANGADVNAKNYSGQTPLSIASSKGHYDIMKFLISKGADVNMKDGDGNAPLHDRNDIDIVELLIKSRADVNVEGSFGQTPLYLVSWDGSHDIMELLISNGADVNMSCGEDSFTPLHIACKRGDSYGVELLLNYGADINAEDRKFKTPFQHAIWNGNYDAARVFHKCVNTVKRPSKRKK